MDKKIVIEIDENGEVKIETMGFKGKLCLEESKWIEEIFGKKVSQHLTPAYFMKEDKEIKKHLPLCG